MTHFCYHCTREVEYAPDVYWANSGELCIVLECPRCEYRLMLTAGVPFGFEQLPPILDEHGNLRRARRKR